MLSPIECPYCTSYSSKLISNFHSAVLNAKTSVYQCEQCLNLFDFLCDVKMPELQKRLSDLQQDAEERTAVAVAANAMRILNNPELGATIAQIQRESLIVQLNLIRQQIVIVNPANQELLERLRKQEVDIQAKLIEVQKKELQRRLSDLQADAEERISATVASDIAIDAGVGESKVVVVVYSYDFLGNHVPVDSFWANSSDIRLSILEFETQTNLDTFTNAADSSVPYSLKLVFGVFQIIFWVWLLCLAFVF